MGKGKDMRLGIDLGGSKIHAVVIDRDGRVRGTARAHTKAEKGYAAVLARIAGVAGEAIGDAGLKWKDVRAVGLGVPGPVDEDAGAIQMAANLGWQPSPVAADLGRLIGRSVVLGNDVNFGGLGEVTYGGARGRAGVFAAFVGTGLGGPTCARAR